MNSRDNVDTLKTVSTKEYPSATSGHLSLNNECSKAYCDDCFSVFRGVTRDQFAVAPNRHRRML